jgi:transcriptional regulator with GAF, ATPase, and Fis domain
MSNQAEESPADLSSVLKRMTDHVSQFIMAVADLRRVFQSNNLQFPPLLTLGLKAVQQDLDDLTKSATGLTTRSQQLEKLVETSTLLTSSLDLDQVLNGVMDTIINLSGAQRAYLMLSEPGSDELTVKAARNFGGTDADKEDMTLSRGVINSAFKDGKPILTTNALLDDRFQNWESIVGYALRSILCIPMILRGQPIGVLYIDNRMREGVFMPDTIPMLTAFANQAAVAIENARLYGQVKADLDAAKQEVQTLRIQIDQKQAESQIDEIANSEFFRRLSKPNPPQPPTTE